MRPTNGLGPFSRLTLRYGAIPALALLVSGVVLVNSIQLVSADPPVIAGDDFREDSFLGGFGWQGAWETTNSVDIVTDDGPKKGTRHLRMRGWSSLSRAVDLSSTSEAQVSFWAKAGSLESGDVVSAEVSKDGETWVLLDSWSKGDDEEGYQNYHYDLSDDGFGEQMFLRFRSNMDDSDDFFFLDDVQIAGESHGADSPPADDEDIPIAPPASAPTAVEEIVIDGQFSDWEGHPNLDDPQGDATKARGDLSLLQWANNGGSEVNFWMIERHPNNPHPKYDEDDDDGDEDDDDGDWRGWAEDHDFDDEAQGKKVKYTIYIDTDNDGDFTETDDRRVMVDYHPHIWDSDVRVRVKAGHGGRTIFSDKGDWGESIAEGGRRVELTVAWEHLGVTSGEVIRMYVESNRDDRLPNSGDIQWSPASVLGYTLLAVLLGVSALVFWRIKSRKEVA